MTNPDLVPDFPHKTAVRLIETGIDEVQQFVSDCRHIHRVAGRLRTHALVQQARIEKLTEENQFLTEQFLEEEIQ